MPTFCMAVSSTLFVAFIGLVALDAWPVGVMVIGPLVVLVMTLQFIVFVIHQCVISVLHIWRAGGVSMVNVV